MSKMREFGIAVLFGPLMFTHGVPEHGPHQPAPLLILGGLIGTVPWVLAAKILYTVLL